MREERTTLNMEDKCNMPEATSTSQAQNRNKYPGPKRKGLPSISGVEATDSRKSKLGRDLSIGFNINSEAEQRLQSATIALKRKRKSSVPKVNIIDIIFSPWTVSLSL